MRKYALIILGLFLLIYPCKSQIIEGISTIYSFKITQVVTETKPPVIEIYSPILTDNTFSTSESEITINGKVSDESGILKFTVNDAEVLINEQGNFNAKQLLAYNDNIILIKATDKNNNISQKSITIKRATISIDNSILITWKSPVNTNEKTSTSPFNIQACISSKSKITEVSVYKNGNFIRNAVFDKEVTFRGNNCDYFVDEKIFLDSSKNEIVIEVITQTGKEKSSRIIDYDMTSGKYYALLIGVNEYNDEKIDDLSNPINDAKKVGEVLTSYYSFDKSNIFLLSNPTRSDITKKLYELRALVSDVDNLLIFYAGHGYFDKAADEGYWFPSDAIIATNENWFSNQDLVTSIKAINAKHSLLIADACFSGGIFKTRAIDFNENPAIATLYKTKSSNAMTSGSLTEVPDKSIFVEYLVKKLEENEKEFLPAQNLFIDVKTPVLSNDKLGNIPQYGTIQNTGDEGGDFIFMKRK